MTHYALHALHVMLKLSSPQTQDFWEIPVLYEDDYLLALDKPSGLLSSPEGPDPNRPNLLKLLHEGIAAGKPWATEHRLSYLMNAHRLDAEVSGVLLLAKAKEALITLNNLFGSERPYKKFLALVQGEPTEERWEVDAAVMSQAAPAGFYRVDPRRGKRARTTFKVLERFAGWALLQAELLTDRPHQIRAHLRSVGLPLVGDPLYDGKPLFLSNLKPGYQPKSGQAEAPLLGRPAVHAEELRLPHPVTGQELRLTAPWPHDLLVALKYLRKYAGGAGGA